MIRLSKNMGTFVKIEPLSKKISILCLLISWGIVSFGQPAWSSATSFLASILGYALIFRVLVGKANWKMRFFIGFIWFAAVQLTQLSWTLSHPYLYIVVPWLLYSLLMGLQFGLISVLADPRKVTEWSRILMICSVWTLCEWSRLFFLSGFAFNPSGMALAGNLYTLQVSSLAGVFGLSFYVLLTNLILLRVWLLPFKWKRFAVFAVFAALPFAFGAVQLVLHQGKVEKSSKVKALLIQTAFPVEEGIHFTSHQDYFDHVFDEWKQIYTLASKYREKPVDLLALPEFVVPFGTYSFVYRYDDVKRMIEERFGSNALKKAAPLVLPFASEDEKGVSVNNAFLSQTLANLFDSQVVIGLEDAEDRKGKRHYFSSAIYFTPLKEDEYRHRRYEKRILVPMGEYIPFSFCRNLAAQYGVFGSFTPGKEAVVWGNDGCRFGVSICYEEIFGDMMRENRIKGATLLLNLTSDAWFPQSKLVRQHFEHARLRTVENGIPLTRACNTGITACVDALGRDVAVLGDSDDEREKLSGALYVDVPMYHYRTLYSQFGDRLIIGFSLLCILLFFRAGKRDQT